MPIKFGRLGTETSQAKRVPHRSPTKTHSNVGWKAKAPAPASFTVGSTATPTTKPVNKSKNWMRQKLVKTSVIAYPKTKHTSNADLSNPPTIVENTTGLAQVWKGNFSFSYQQLNLDVAVIRSSNLMMCGL